MAILTMTAVLMQAQTVNDTVAHRPTYVVCDIETGVPLREVKVHLNTGRTCVTNYRGQWQTDSTFESATVSHPRYLSRVVQRTELQDTLYLLPKGNTLGDVTVWGVDRRGIKGMMKQSTSGLAAYAPSGGLVSFNFFDLFRKKPLNAKARKKNQELLKDWDRVYADPLAPVPQQQSKSPSVATVPGQTFISVSGGVAQNY